VIINCQEPKSIYIIIIFNAIRMEIFIVADSYKKYIVIK